MLVLDSSALYALADADDSHHRAAADAFDADRGPRFVPVAILAEIAYMLESRLGALAVDALLAGMIDGSLTCDFDARDLLRVRELAQTYRDLALGLADASVVACAERIGAPILTFDRRDFGVVARAGTIQLVP